MTFRCSNGDVNSNMLVMLDVCLACVQHISTFLCRYLGISRVFVGEYPG